MAAQLSLLLVSPELVEEVVVVLLVVVELVVVLDVVVLLVVVEEVVVVLVEEVVVDVSELLLVLRSLLDVPVEDSVLRVLDEPVDTLLDDVTCDELAVGVLEPVVDGLDDTWVDPPLEVDVDGELDATVLSTLEDEELSSDEERDDASLDEPRREDSSRDELRSLSLLLPSGCEVDMPEDSPGVECALFAPERPDLELPPADDAAVVLAPTCASTPPSEKGLTIPASLPEQLAAATPELTMRTTAPTQRPRPRMRASRSKRSSYARDRRRAAGTGTSAKLLDLRAQGRDA